MYLIFNFIISLVALVVGFSVIIFTLFYYLNQKSFLSLYYILIQALMLLYIIFEFLFLVKKNSVLFFFCY